MDRYVIKDNKTGEVEEYAEYMIPKLYSCDTFTDKNILRRDYESYLEILDGEEKESYVYDWNSPYREIHETEQEYYKAMVEYATFTSKDGIKPINEVLEIKTTDEKVQNKITLHVMHNEDILYESSTPFTKEDMLDLRSTFRKGEQYAKSFEQILNNLDKLAEQLDFKVSDVLSIILDTSLADDEFYIYNKKNKVIAYIEVVTSKQAEENELDFIEGTEIEKEYKLFDPDTSNYIPLNKEKTWAFREM